MSEVKRYNTDIGKFGAVRPYESEHGRWVKHSDYAALEAERERLKRENANIRAKWTEYGREVEAERDALRAELAALKVQTEQQPVALQHVAYAEDGALHWMTGRKVGCCELYAMPDFGRAPELYAAPIAQPPADGLVEALQWCEDWFVKHCPTSKVDGFFPIVHPMLTSIRNALAAHRQEQPQ